MSISWLFFDPAPPGEIAMQFDLTPLIDTQFPKTRRCGARQIAGLLRNEGTP